MRKFDESQLVHPGEKRLFVLSFAVALLFWVVLTIGTIGFGLLYVLLMALFVAIGHGLYLAYIKGYGVRITKQQFPEIYEVATGVADRMELDEVPDMYLYNMDGMINAFATHFFSRNFVVITSEMMNACGEDKKKWAFIIGHEMAHLKRKHTRWMAFLAPSRILPWVGKAYSRACEYTCDAFGAYYGAESTEEAIKAVQVLATGNKRWADAITADAYEAQVRDNRGFFATLAEINATHPFTAKRVLHLRRFLGEEEIKPVRHNILGVLLAPFFSLQFWILAYVLFIFATIGWAAYAGYKENISNGQSMLEAIQSSAAALESPSNTEDRVSPACETAYSAYMETEVGSEEELQAEAAYEACEAAVKAGA